MTRLKVVKVLILITLTASGTIASTVGGGAGNDSVNFTGATAFSGYVDLGAGGDTIKFFLS